MTFDESTDLMADFTSERRENRGWANW